MRVAALLVAIVLAGCATTQRVGCIVPPPTAAEELLPGVVATFVIASVVAAGYVAIGGEVPLR